MNIAIISSINPKDDIRIYQKFGKSYSGFSNVDYYCTDFVQNNANEITEKINYIEHKKPMGLISRIRLLKEIYNSLEGNVYDYVQISNIELLLLVPFLYKKHKIIFDMHEDFEGTLEDKHSLPKYMRKLAAKAYKKIVNYYIKTEKLKYTFVTTPLIKEKFPQKNVYIIENFAPLLKQSNEPSKIEQAVKIQNENHFNIVFTGLMTKERGILQVIRSIEALNHVDFYLIGLISKDFKQEVNDLINALKLTTRVFVYESLPYIEMMLTIKRMDAGIIPYLSNKNHVVTRPNKLFEYMAAKKPVLCSSFPLYEEVVNRGCGLTFIPEEIDSITKTIQKLRDSDHEEMGEKGYDLYMNYYNWGVEEKKLRELLQTAAHK